MTKKAPYDTDAMDKILSKNIGKMDLNQSPFDFDAYTNWYLKGSKSVSALKERIKHLLGRNKKQNREL